MFEILPEVAQW